MCTTPCYRCLFSPDSRLFSTQNGEIYRAKKWMVYILIHLRALTIFCAIVTCKYVNAQRTKRQSPLAVYLSNRDHQNTEIRLVSSRLGVTCASASWTNGLGWVDLLDGPTPITIPSNGTWRRSIRISANYMYNFFIAIVSWIGLREGKTQTRVTSENNQTSVRFAIGLFWTN